MAKPAAVSRTDSPYAALQADGWVQGNASNFLRHVGPVWTRMQDGATRFGFLVEDRHDNTQQRAHGGMIMTLCDDAMGSCAQAARPGERLFTATFDCQFISGAGHGDFVEVHCEVVKSTRSLVFMRSTCVAGDRVVAACSGVWKVLGK